LPRKAVIIGAGPAGLTAAYELLGRTDIQPLVLEKSEYMGGIARTVTYRGNRIDIGGHRFFSKSDRVMKWWLDILPLQSTGNQSFAITYQNSSRSVKAPAEERDPARVDRVMLVRGRKSRILYLRKFFDYPLSLSPRTLGNLGLWRTARISLSYLKSALFPIRNEKTLEQFFINRFGQELYLTFFKSYTEKVWGVPCHQIGAEWGAQRVKGLSITKTLLHAARKLFGKRSGDIAQKGVETSLIEQFLYPKFGPGQMWEEVARQVREKGGEIRTGWTVTSVIADGTRVRGVRAVNQETGEESCFEGDFVFSTAPIKELLAGFSPPPPAAVKEVSDGLVYRDFITVGLLVPRLKIGPAIEDNWIYIQEPDVLLGRLQIFNNWSPYMVAKPGTVWLGLEYFCNQNDELWNKSDSELAALGARELAKIGVIENGDVLDSTVLRMEKTYPAYFGSYDRFPVIREFVDRFDNLFLLGRNGMHRYNNQDHSMLTAMMAVDNIAAGVTSKDNLWEVNTEQDYHEEKSAGEERAEASANTGR
jgi:protoporphyrinogen oxidase